jgi:hypothetical protein
MSLIVSDCRLCRIEAKRDRQAAVARRLAAIQQQAANVGLFSLGAAFGGVAALGCGEREQSDTVMVTGLVALGLATVLFVVTAVLALVVPAFTRAYDRASRRPPPFGAFAPPPPAPPPAMTPANVRVVYRSAPAVVAPPPSGLCRRHEALAKQNRDARAVAPGVRDRV